MNGTNRKTFKLKRIAVPLVREMMATSMTLPLEMMEAAYIYSSNLYPKGYADKFKVGLYATSCAPMRVTGGIQLIPDGTLERSGNVDLVLIPALWRNPLISVRKNPEIVAWIKYQYEQGACLVVAGTGVVFVAASGLLDHQVATTHWFYLKKLQKKFPLINFKPNHLLTSAGNIYCAGSVNSVADLIVHIIGLSFDQTVALKVEQQFSHEIRKPFAELHFSSDQVKAHQDEVIVRLQSWLHEFYANSIDNSCLCKTTGLAARTLNRRFKQAVGLSPTVYIQKLRVRHAKDLLKQTNLSIAEIAQQVGYPDPEYFTRVFKKHCQLTPLNFRKSVREKLFALHL